MMPEGKADGCCLSARIQLRPPARLPPPGDWFSKMVKAQAAQLQQQQQGAAALAQAREQDTLYLGAHVADQYFKVRSRISGVGGAVGLPRYASP